MDHVQDADICSPSAFLLTPCSLTYRPASKGQLSECGKFSSWPHSLSSGAHPVQKQTPAAKPQAIMYPGAFSRTVASTFKPKHTPLPFWSTPEDACHNHSQPGPRTRSWDISRWQLMMQVAAYSWLVMWYGESPGGNCEHTFSIVVWHQKQFLSWQWH